MNLDTLSRGHSGGDETAGGVVPGCLLIHAPGIPND